MTVPKSPAVVADGPVPDARALVPDWHAVCRRGDGRGAGDRARGGVPGEPGGRPARRWRAPGASAGGCGGGRRSRPARSWAVFGVDENRERRLFEAVRAAVESLVVGVEVVRPGLVAGPGGTGASAYFGGRNTPLVERLVDEVSAAAGVECQVGISEGLFADDARGSPGRLGRALAVARISSPRCRSPNSTSRVRTGRSWWTCSDASGCARSARSPSSPRRTCPSASARRGVLAHRLARGPVRTSAACAAARHPSSPWPRSSTR